MRNFAAPYRKAVVAGLLAALAALASVPVSGALFTVTSVVYALAAGLATAQATYLAENRGSKPVVSPQAVSDDLSLAAQIIGRAHPAGAGVLPIERLAREASAAVSAAAHAEQPSTPSPAPRPAPAVVPGTSIPAP